MPREFQLLYAAMSQAVLLEVVRTTGCLPPCSYREYRTQDYDVSFHHSTPTKQCTSGRDF